MYRYGSSGTTVAIDKATSTSDLTRDNSPKPIAQIRPPTEGSERLFPPTFERIRPLSTQFKSTGSLKLQVSPNGRIFSPNSTEFGNQQISTSQDSTPKSAESCQSINQFSYSTNEQFSSERCRGLGNKSQSSTNNETVRKNSKNCDSIYKTKLEMDQDRRIFTRPTRIVSYNSVISPTDFYLDTFLEKRCKPEIEWVFCLNCNRYVLTFLEKKL